MDYGDSYNNPQTPLATASLPGYRALFFRETPALLHSVATGGSGHISSLGVIATVTVIPALKPLAGDFVSSRRVATSITRCHRNPRPSTVETGSIILFRKFSPKAAAHPRSLSVLDWSLCGDYLIPPSTMFLEAADALRLDRVTTAIPNVASPRTIEAS